ncbi:hypothetical protein ACIRQQ_20015 [Streptomyces fuscichromogenes]|uniref:golvesin C-terminal-like domain-containing protein n=1 Tax=Streptomyces fuscichromogenes TaxID=1324013 RepID=UPI00380ED113
MPRDGGYEVQVSWPPAAGRASNVPCTLVRADGSTATVRIDRRAAGVTDPRGGTWFPLGVFELTAGLGTLVELTNDADGPVAADAVRLLGPLT